MIKKCFRGDRDRAKNSICYDPTVFLNKFPGFFQAFSFLFFFQDLSRPGNSSFLFSRFSRCVGTLNIIHTLNNVILNCTGVFAGDHTLEQ